MMISTPHLLIREITQVFLVLVYIYNVFLQNTLTIVEMTSLLVCSVTI